MKESRTINLRLKINYGGKTPNSSFNKVRINYRDKFN